MQESIYANGSMGKNFRRSLKEVSDDGPAAFRTGDLSYIFGDGH